LLAQLISLLNGRQQAADEVTWKRSTLCSPSYCWKRSMQYDGIGTAGWSTGDIVYYHFKQI